MKKKTLYIAIALLVLLNIGQFVYFYSVISDLKRDNEILKMKNSQNDNHPVEDPDNGGEANW